MSQVNCIFMSKNEEKTQEIIDRIMAKNRHLQEMKLSYVESKFRFFLRQADNMLIRHDNT